MFVFFFSSSLQMQEVQQSKETTLVSNRTLAEQNLALQPRLDHKKDELTKRYRGLQESFESFQLRKSTLGTAATRGGMKEPASIGSSPHPECLMFDPPRTGFQSSSGKAYGTSFNPRDPTHYDASVVWVGVRMFKLFIFKEKYHQWAANVFTRMIFKNVFAGSI